MQLYAFDVLALDGDDLRNLPLHLRKTNLARLLARRPEGIFVSEFEQGEIGPDLFRQACKFGLEGLVSKRRESVYRGGRSPNWIKVKAKTRRGTLCQSPQTKHGRCRLHGGAPGTGAPSGKRNGSWKHGRYSQESIELRRLIRKLMREARATMAGAGL